MPLKQHKQQKRRLPYKHEPLIEAPTSQQIALYKIYAREYEHEVIQKLRRVGPSQPFGRPSPLSRVTYPPERPVKTDRWLKEKYKRSKSLIHFYRERSSSSDTLQVSQNRQASGHSSPKPRNPYIQSALLDSLAEQQHQRAPGHRWSGSSHLYTQKQSLPVAARDDRTFLSVDIPRFELDVNFEFPSPSVPTSDILEPQDTTAEDLDFYGAPDESAPPGCRCSLCTWKTNLPLIDPSYTHLLNTLPFRVLCASKLQTLNKSSMLGTPPRLTGTPPQLTGTPPCFCQLCTMKKQLYRRDWLTWNGLMRGLHECGLWTEWWCENNMSGFEEVERLVG